MGELQIMLTPYGSKNALNFTPLVLLAAQGEQLSAKSVGNAYGISSLPVNDEFIFAGEQLQGADGIFNLDDLGLSVGEDGSLIIVNQEQYNKALPYAKIIDTYMQQHLEKRDAALKKGINTFKSNGEG